MTLAIIDGDIFLHIAMWKIDNLNDAKSKLNTIFKTQYENSYATDYVMALGGPNNFRYKLYKDYKSNRGPRPEWFEDLKYYFSRYSNAVLTDGYEADDQVRIWSVECDTAGIDHFIMTGDKDLDCISGYHYDPKKEIGYKVEEDYSTWFFWKQVLMGDGIDKIPGIKGCGPKTADKLLHGLSTEEEYKTVVYNAYHNAYGDEGFNHLLMNCKLLHIWRWYGDHYTIPKDEYLNAIKS